MERCHICEEPAVGDGYVVVLGRRYPMCRTHINAVADNMVSLQAMEIKKKKATEGTNATRDSIEF